MPAGRLGFQGNDALGPDIAEIHVRFFTEASREDFTVEVEGVWIARNAVELSSVLRAANGDYMHMVR